MGRGGASDAPQRWGIILAGGEGVRLRPLTRRIVGDDRPKQFCQVLGFETLLDRTRRRVAGSVPPDRTLVVVTRCHERFYAPVLGDVPLRCVVAQPENRGTAPAILHGLLRVAAAAPLGLVAVFPSDHYVSDDAAFMAHVDAAFETARERPDLVILFGMTPESPEVAYGWIEPGEPIPVPHGPLHRVRRFWEKPSAAVAERLLRRGALWNIFVIVARVTALLALVRRATPQLYEGFANVRAAVDTAREAEALAHLYARLPSVNFSREVLARRAANLAVLPVRGVDWSDLGEPDRVVATLARLGRSVTWREPAVVASA